MSEEKLDDVCSDLQHLLDIGVGLLMSVTRRDDIKDDLDRVGALLWVTRHMAKKAVADVASYPPVTP